MKTSSNIVKVARVILVTGLMVIALILLATYSTAPRFAAMMQSQNKTESEQTASAPSVDPYEMIDGTGIAAPMMYRLEDSISLTTAAATASAPAPDQRIIKTGSVDMSSNDVNATVIAVTSLAEAREGFVQSSSASDDSTGRTSAFITIRVPVEIFEKTITDIKTLGVHVYSESSTGEDVTEQYTDVSARLTAAKAQEEQYLVILKTAESVGDVLAVQEHLARVRSDIESLQGQINYLASRTSLATINVTISEEPTAFAASSSKFDPTRDASSAVSMVITLGQNILSALIWIAIIGAAVGIPVAIIALIVLLIARHRNAAPKHRK